MSALIPMRLRLEPGRIRRALLNPVGLALLGIALLVPLALLAVLGADEWIDRALLIPVVGLLAYAATVLAYLFVEDWPDDPEMWSLLAVSRNMKAQLRPLQSDRGNVANPALLPVVAESIRKMDRQIIPDFRRIVVRRDRLERELKRYDEGVLPLPSARLLDRLRRIAAERRAAMSTIVGFAANTDAVLRGLREIDDTSRSVEEARFWQADLQDIEDALTDVLAGCDPFETAMSLLQPGAPVPGAAADLSEVATALAEAGSTRGVAAAEVAVEAGPAIESRPRRRAYPDGLTRREVEVLALLADGRKSTQIADDLVIEPATVNQHIQSIYDKTGHRGRANATRYALKHGITWPIDDAGDAAVPSSQGQSRPSASAPRSAPDDQPDDRAIELMVLLELAEGRSYRHAAERLGVTVEEAMAAFARARTRLAGGRRMP